MAGVRLVPLETTIEDGFRLPIRERIEENLTGKTKAILLCSPNNPTGTVYTQEELTMIAQIVKEHNLFLLSDEVYREFVYDGGTHTSILHLPGLESQAILLDSISKRFSACGARIGCIVSRNREVMEIVLRFGQARLCPPTLEQWGAIAGYRILDKYLPGMIAEYERRRNLVYESIQKIQGVLCRKPAGAFYIISRLPVEDAEDFSTWLLTNFHLEGKTVMLAHANGFYVTPHKGKNEVRIAYVLKEEELKEAMKILAEGLKVYTKNQEDPKLRSTKKIKKQQNF